MDVGGEGSLEGLEEQQLEVFPSDLCQPILLSQIFGNDRPVEIDLGSGSGKFLVEAGVRYPGRNFLGIERLLGRVRKTRRKACQLKLANVRVLRVEIEYAVRYLLLPNSVSRFHLSFPDPWPERAHPHRLLADEEFLGAINTALEPNGELWIKTDHVEYFRWIEKIVTLPGPPLAELPFAHEYPNTDFDETVAA